ncbi:flagella basal body P-ring formation protein FlgA [Litorivivens lipolytica]|uniref:Flagella basal body P-ring formation protein FlgA n=1 Tax=Litorivivens lipolytica TaxID=1524264 RepID=A0A7W4W2R8_9GAMM|nr:flagellar basal body P-ring formation chaperone FlgA [Litorivivens lipolytica]MBB3046387.1 flagella basal body P-ring formation protein FlgA [Litorivivens lipolytica]
MTGDRKPQRSAHRVLACLLATLVTSPLALASNLQSESSIRRAAERFIADRNPWRDHEHRIEAGRLDSRSRLPRCAGAVKAFLPSRAQIKRRTTVGVRCEQGASWTVYLPVNITAYAKALVAIRPLPAGTVLGPNDVKSVKREVSAMGYGYISSLNQHGGYRVSRAIAQGAVISPNMVESAVMIKRGQSVRILARSGAVGVTMSGVATSKASLGERITVKNVNSGRVVEGIVRSGETVEIIL